MTVRAGAETRTITEGAQAVHESFAEITPEATLQCVPEALEGHMGTMLRNL